MKIEISKELFNLLTYALLVSVLADFAWIFLLAYFDASKVVCVDINAVGEANIELVLLILIIVMTVVNTRRVLDDVGRDGK